MSARDLIAQMVALAGGTITGRVRLQKIVYLLTRKGLGGDFAFSYHHYGPFSRGVDEAISEAKAFCDLHENMGRRVSDGAPFSVFILSQHNEHRPATSLGSIPIAQAERDIAAMVAVPSTVIEIAATIEWLRHDERVQDWRMELIRRKGVKAGGGRIDQALALLEKLRLEEPTIEKTFSA